MTDPAVYNRYGEKLSEKTEAPKLYTAYEERNGDIIATGYAYGLPLVSQALMMDDLKFPTPEAAKAWWEKNYGEGEK